VTVSGGNAATDGGAFLVSDEILNLNNVVVSGNTAGVDGGAVVITSSGGKLFATNSKFLNNVANTSGGAIATNANALVTLTGCVLEGNSALINGGAIDLNLGNLIINSSLLAGNSASGKGGAISLSQVLGTLSISNSTLSGNSSNTSGGAISTDHAGGTLKISNTTIADNFTAGTGGGLFHSGSKAQPGNTVVVSSIIYGNVSTSADVDVAAVQFKYSASAIGSTIGGGEFIDAGGNLPIGTNPLIGPLANNGGASRTHGLLGASPAIDKGANPDSLAFDQRGTGFPRVLNGTPDMGAFEGSLPVPGGILTPVATIDAAGPIPNTVTVTYVDETGINVASIDVNDIEIIAPDLVTKLTITGVTTSGSGKSVTATYTFAVPVNAKAGWDTSDNGTYTVNLKAGQVFDTDVPTPNANFFQPLGNFDVQVPIVYTVDLVSDVDDGNTSVGQLTLREAIGLANTDGQPSLIQFSPTAFSSAKTIVTAAGEMFITAAVKIVGPTAKLTLDAAGVGRIFNINDTVNAGALVDISNLSIINGNVVGVNGGGIILGGDDNLTLTNVLLSGNTTDADGGGVFAAGKNRVTIVNSVISNNVASGTASQGGGFRLGTAATLDIQNSAVSGNTAGGNGGGWYFFDGGSLLVTNSSVTGNKSNTATGGLGGGGGYFFGAASGKGIVISGSTFSGNSSGKGLGGGGLMIQAGSGSLTIQNSTFSGNTANTGDGGGYGGAILANQGFVGAVVFSNNTFAFNDAGKNGGGFAWTGAAVTMNSTIIAKNTVNGVGTGAGADLFSLTTVISGSNNLIGINDASTKVSFTGSNPLIGSVATPINPLLGALANNGGPTFTHALLQGSPALNAGNNVAGLAFDQRGSGFNRTVGGGTDIGAYEEQVVATPAKVTGVVINGGAAQRSRVTSLKVTFDQQVSFNNIANAFTLTRVSDSASVTLNTVLDGSGTFVTITFTGGAVDGANPVRSLADGRYTLTAVASEFAGSGLDGDGNGTGGDNFVFASTPFVNVNTPATGVFRLFGDNNGNGQVGTDDFLAFRLAFLSATDAFDNDGNGTVDASDFLRFRLNFLATIV
jgi:hypothetical protein